MVVSVVLSNAVDLDPLSPRGHKFVRVNLVDTRFRISRGFCSGSDLDPDGQWARLDKWVVFDTYFSYPHICKVRCLAVFSLLSYRANCGTKEVWVHH